MFLCRFSIILTFVLTCCVGSSSIAQEPVSYNLNDENGLPSNEVYQVLQDDFGFMWIGCDAGLFRYDGFSYKQYKNANQNGRAISDIKLDKKGRVWARNFKGEIYCVANEKLNNVTKNVNISIAHAVYELDEEDNCWLLDNGKLSKVDATGKILFSKEMFYNSERIETINSIAINQQLIYFSDRENSLFCYSIKDKKLNKIEKKSVQSEKNTFFRRNGELHVMSEDTRTNMISIFQITGLKCSFITTITLTSSNPRVYTITSDNTNRSWICTANGFGSYDNDLNNLSSLNCYLQGKNVSSLIRDKEGNYWVSTLQEGIFVIPSLTILKFDLFNSSIPENNLTALKSVNENELLIGTYSGKVLLYHLQKGEFSEIKAESSIKTTSVKFFYPYKGSFYVSHGPLSEIKNRRFVKSHSLFNTKGIEIVDENLHFLMSEFHGSLKLEELDNPATIVYNKPGGRHMLFSPGDQTFYYALNSGLLSLKNGKWTEIKNKGKSIHASGMILHKNKVCVASLSNGLFIISKSTIIDQFTSDNSNVEDDLKNIHANENYVWVCGLNSLMRINLAKREVTRLSNYNGINTKDINAIETLNGKIYLATNKGLIIFPENHAKKNKLSPSIRIEKILLNGKKIILHDQLDLPFDNTRLIVKLASISFKSRGNYTYEYRICGIDRTWTSMPAVSTSIQFNTIPPGEYQFQVRALNIDGVSSDTLSFRLKVASPLWQKWWFYLIVSLLVIGSIALIFYYRLTYIKRKADQLNKLTASQLSALKAQMNPHFMFNALNSIQELVLQNDTLNSNIYLSKFSHLMRNILNASDADKLSLKDEIDILQLYLDLEKLRFKDDFNFEISLSSDIDPYTINIPSMILQPFVENALKHGLLHKKGHKKLFISFTLNEQLICIIEDNGIGRKHAQEIKERQRNSTASFATQATEKRIELLNSYNHENYTFEIVDLFENEVASGTRVIITLPIR